MAIDVALQLELEDLYSRYASLLDDGPLRDWPDLFAEQCLYLLIPRDNYDRGLPLAIIRCESRGMLVDRVRAAQETIMHEPRYLRHQITNVRVTATAGARIDATAHFSVMEVLPDELPQHPLRRAIHRRAPTTQRWRARIRGETLRLRLGAGAEYDRLSGVGSITCRIRNSSRSTSTAR